MAAAWVAAEGTPRMGAPFDVVPHWQSGGGAEPYFHGPSTIVAANGDLLLATAQGRSHGIGVIVQSRSTDRGASWGFEGVIYDHGKRQPGGSAYNPAYALAPDGRLILTVQTTSADALKRSGEKAGFAGYVYLISSDHGKTYQHKGFIDPRKPKNVGAVTTNLLTRSGTIYLVSSSYEAGCLLYTSRDNGETWQLRSAVFPRGDIAAPLWYPTLAILPDSRLYVLALARLPDLEERNYTRVSADDGRTWGAVRLAEGISVRHPVLSWLGKTLLVHGRHTPSQDVVLHYSLDNGQTWSPRQIIEDYDSDGGYSSSALVDGRLFIAFSSDARRQQRPRTNSQYRVSRICSIRGVFLAQ